MTTLRVVVFAKAPQPGRVKTRLIPALGAAGAARLAARMLEHTLAQALAAGIGTVELRMSPAPGSPAWAATPLPPAISCRDQGDGDLGARMARAARDALTTDAAVLLIGTDCPALDAVRLRTAAARLCDHDAVLHRAADGGYPLLGLRVFDPGLFEDMPWSTPAVAGLTLARLAALDRTVWLGETLADVDVPADLAAYGELAGFRVE